MARGFMGKILNVDLSARRMWDEVLDDSICRNFLGGYVLGAKLLYDRDSAKRSPHRASRIVSVDIARP